MYNVAVVGATGNVGRKILSILKERNFPIDNLYLFASKRSAGTKMMFRDKEYVIEETCKENIESKKLDFALFSAGGDTSLEFAPVFAKLGAIVIDNSSAWRMDPKVPLVVPEVNPEDITWNNGIIANPNCSTIQAMPVLKAIDEKFGLKRVVYSTYQAVSGAGMQAIKDLEEGYLGVAPKKFPKPIAGNVLPHIDVFLENGYTKEEMKMINETRKILHLDNLKVTATTVRVPVLNSHSESINVEVLKPFELNDVVKCLEEAKGVTVYDDVANLKYPTPLEASDKDDVFVGRIRRDFSIDNGLNLWVVSDNIRKGAALNAVQIAELLIKNK